VTSGPHHEEHRPAPRRFRRWLLLGVALLTALLLLALALRNRIARRVLPRLLGPALGLEVEVEAVTISFRGRLGVRGLKGTEPAEWTQVRRLEIPKLDVEASLFGLVARGLEAVERIEAAGVVLELDVDRPGAPEAPEAEEAPAALELPAALPRIDLHLESLQVSWEEGRIRLQDAKLGAHPEEARSRVRLAGALDWRLGERAAKDDLVLTFAYAAGILDELRLEVSGAPLIRRGRVDPVAPAAELVLGLGDGEGEVRLEGVAPERLEVSAELRRVRLEEVFEVGLDDPSPVRGVLDLSLEGSLPAGAPLAGKGRFSLALRRGAVKSLEVDRADVSGSLDAGRLEIDALDIEAADIELRASRLGADIDPAGPAEVLSSLAGEIELSSPDLSRALALLRDLEVPADLLELGAGASLRIDLGIDPGLLQVRSLRLDSPAFDVAVHQGRLEIDARHLASSRLELAGRAGVRDLPRLGAALGLEVEESSGEVDVVFRAGGSLTAPLADLEIRGKRLVIAGVALGELEAEAAGSPAAVEVRSLRLEAADEPHYRLELSAALDLAGELIERLALRLEGSGLRSRLAPLEGAVRFLPEDPLELALEASGPLRWPDLALEARTQRGAPRRPEVATLDLRKRGDALELAAVSLAVEQFLLSTRLRGAVAEGARAGSLEIDTLAVSRRGDTWSSAEAAAVRFDLDGPLLIIDPPLVIEGPNGRLSAGLAPVREDPGAGLIATLHFMVRDRLPLGIVPELEVAAIDLDLTARYGEEGLALGLIPVTADLQARAEGLTLAGAALDFEASAAADRAAMPPRAALSLEIPALTIFALPDGTPLRERASGRLSLRAGLDEEGALLIEALEGFLDSIRLQGRGRIEMPELGRLFRPEDAGAATGRLDLALEVEVDFDELLMIRELVPDLRRLGGGARLEAGLRGTLGRPELDAILVLERIDVRHEELPQVDNLSGRLVLAENRLTFEQVSGELGASPFVLAGWIDQVFDRPWFEMRLSGENLLLVRSEDVILRADTDLHLSGAVDALAASGSLQVTDGRVLHDVALLDIGALVRLIAGLGRAGPGVRVAAPRAAGVQLFSLREPPFDDLRFDISVGARLPIRVRGSLFRAELEPELRLRGTGEVPYLSGTLYIRDLLVQLPVTRIRFEAGFVRFDEADPFFPELNLVGFSRVHGYEVTVSIGGRINDPIVTFASSPPLPADELVLLVTTGQRPRPEGGGLGQLALITAARYLGTDLLRRLFGRPELEERETFLDRLELDVGRNISREGRETIEARFELVERSIAGGSLSLVGERDEYQDYNIGLRLVFRGR
jgi:hypothetical protein